MRCLTTRNRCNRKTTSRIPLDVILEILSWLPAKFALRFKCVCKEWCDLINGQFFAKLHLNKLLQSDSRHNHSLFCTSTFRIVDDFYRPSRWTKLNWPKDIRRLEKAYCHVVGSCNGLVCFKLYTDVYGTYFTVKCFLICNPTTRSFKLFFPSSEKTWRDDSLSYGFGYDSEHDDYKIVVTSRVWTESDRDVRIYSLKADLWSYPTPPTRVSFGRRWENRKYAIFKDKMLHYLVSDEIVLGDGRSQVSKDYRIARFDVVMEKWRDDLSLPQLKNRVQLGELDGRLYLRGGDYSSEVWIMEEHGSWKKTFLLPTKFERHQLIALSKEGRHRLLLQNIEGDGRDLKWYDHQASKVISFTLKVPWYSSVMLCIASLVTIPGCSSEKLHYIKKKRAKRSLLGCIGLSS